jgi:hypothetical protein
VLPQRCSDQGVWEDQTACVAPTTKCVLGRCEPPDTIGTACRTADEALFEVQWTTTTTPAGTSYRVRSIGGSPSAPGWKLHHRPARVATEYYFARDHVVTDSDIIDYEVPLELIPSPYPDLGPELSPLSILTCPDGTCVASPVKSDCKTVYEKPPGGPPRPPRIAVVGDELLAQNQSCRARQPAPVAPDYCARTLEEVLRGRNYSSWVSYQEGTGVFKWLEVVREQATTRPDVMVLAVATHDVWRILEAPEVGRPRARQDAERSVYEAIDAVRAENAEARVVLVTASTRGTPEYTAEATLLNQVLWRIRDEADYGKILVAGWDVVAPIHCGTAWLEPNGPKCELFMDDQIHLRGAGDELRNDFIAFTIHYAFNPLPQPASALVSESR